ncbi:hypothetical protein J7L02_02435, partial [Candidatus Woesearchaeota archaeon]|nr:hypothetical protein [Candidatus Woesearchaeota archaeon]
AYYGGAYQGGAYQYPYAPVCEENWDCTPWSECQPDGFMYRNCTDLNHCGTTRYKPAEKKPCKYEGNCSDGIKNCHDGACEEGIDCGGPCPPCATCSDGIQNCHDGSCEEGIDCGGPCPPCATCNDGIQNCHDGLCEEGIDCGGPCPPCAKKKPVIEYPLFLCERHINWRSPWLWFYILSVLTAIIVRALYARHRYKYWRGRKDLPAVQRVKLSLSEERKAYMFGVSLTVLSVIIGVYYYYFGLCPPYNVKMWWLLVIMLLFAPLIIHRVLKIFEYDELKKILAMERVLNTHYNHVLRLLKLQDIELAERERAMSRELSKLVVEKKSLIEQYPAIKRIIKELDRLYKVYLEHKAALKYEKKLLEDVVRLKESPEFKQASVKEPLLKHVRDLLEDLYKQYEERHALYEELTAVEQEIIEKVSGSKILKTRSEAGNAFLKKFKKVLKLGREKSEKPKT